MARLIEKVVGHQAEIQRLAALVENHRWPHAVLFVGPSGVGKKKLALAFAQMLVCEKTPTACGICGACLRIEKQQSESLTLIEPDDKAAREVIKVDAIRALLDSLSLASLGSSRVVIIDQAHTMNDQAANALLKTLEEPSKNVFFILIGEDPEQFLPTIRSRTQIFRWANLSDEDVKKIKPAQPDWAYRSCRGQIDRLELLTSDEGLKKREESFMLFEKFCEDQQFLLAPDWKAALKERSWALFQVQCWQQILRDLIVLKTQAQKFILNTDQITRLKKLYQIQSQKLLQLSDDLIEAEKSINGNADPVLVFENAWVKYARMD